MDLKNKESFSVFKLYLSVSEGESVFSKYYSQVWTTNFIPFKATENSYSYSQGPANSLYPSHMKLFISHPNSLISIRNNIYLNCIKVFVIVSSIYVFELSLRLSLFQKKKFRPHWRSCIKCNITSALTVKICLSPKQRILWGNKSFSAVHDCLCNTLSSLSCLYEET